MTIQDLENGTISRLTVSTLATLANQSPVTIRRKIKSGQIKAGIDPATKRIFISAVAALNYLRCDDYSGPCDSARAAGEQVRQAKNQQQRLLQEAQSLSLE